MFGLFRSQPFRDAQLGEFVRARGLWRGSVSFDSTSTTPLVLAGSRSRPDPVALSLARGLSEMASRIRHAVAPALFEHYQPYAEAIAQGEAPPHAGVLPHVVSPDDVWPYVTLQFVSVTHLDGVLTAEFGYDVVWDEEHTLGARFRDGQFLELCGSVLPP